jgi:hypothetical protein
MVGVTVNFIGKNGDFEGSIEGFRLGRTLGEREGILLGIREGFFDTTKDGVFVGI